MFNNCNIGLRDIHGRDIKNGDMMKLPEKNSITNLTKVRKIQHPLLGRFPEKVLY